jgi:integrase
MPTAQADSPDEGTTPPFSIAPQNDEGSEDTSITSAPALADLAGRALQYHDAALSENTRKAYRRGWEDFTGFCEAHGLPVDPPTERSVALYLTARAGELAVSTLDQRLAAIQHVCDQEYRTSPTRRRSIRRLMQGIRREESRKPEQAAPLLTDQIKEMVDALPGTGRQPEGRAAGARWLRGLRDRAILLVGYAGALRRSEIAGIRVGDLDARPGGALLTILRSKSDPDGEGQLVALRTASEASYCPVRSLQRWTQEAEIDEGAVFRGVPRTGDVAATALTGRTVANVVQGAVEAAGLPSPEDYSAHSLRAGHITQATLNGVPDGVIQEQSRHKSDRAFREYVRPVQLLETASSGELGL